MKWSGWELNYLKKVYPSNVSVKEIVRRLGKSSKAIKHKASRMGLSRPNPPINKPKDKNHRNKYDRLYYERNKDKIYENKIKRIRDYKIKLITLLGGKCIQCGYNKSPVALDFHHKDRNKENAISSMLHRASREKILEETNKCILLCSNCHRELHYFKGT